MPLGLWKWQATPQIDISKHSAGNTATILEVRTGCTLTQAAGLELSAWLGCHFWNNNKKGILLTNKGLLCTCSKSKGSCKTHNQISQTHQKAILDSVRLTMWATCSCSNTVLTASLGHFPQQSRMQCNVILHASLDTRVCSIPFPEIRKKQRKRGKITYSCEVSIFCLHIAVAAVVNWETKIGWQIYLLKGRQMEKQPEKNELPSKRGTAAWKQSNTLNTDQLQQRDLGLNGAGKKKKSSQNVFKSRCKSYFGELWN